MKKFLTAVMLALVSMPVMGQTAPIIPGGGGCGEGPGENAADTRRSYLEQISRPGFSLTAYHGVDFTEGDYDITVDTANYLIEWGQWSPSLADYYFLDKPGTYYQSKALSSPSSPWYTDTGLNDAIYDTFTFSEGTGEVAFWDNSIAKCDNDTTGEDSFVSASLFRISWTLSLEANDPALGNIDVTISKVYYRRSGHVDQQWLSLGGNWKYKDEFDNLITVPSNGIFKGTLYSTPYYVDPSSAPSSVDFDFIDTFGN